MTIVQARLRLPVATLEMIDERWTSHSPVGQEVADVINELADSWRGDYRNWMGDRVYFLANKAAELLRTDRLEILVSPAEAPPGAIY